MSVTVDIGQHDSAARTCADGGGGQCEPRCASVGQSSSRSYKHAGHSLRLCGPSSNHSLGSVKQPPSRPQPGLRVLDVVGALCHHGLVRLLDLHQLGSQLLRHLLANARLKLSLVPAATPPSDGQPSPSPGRHMAGLQRSPRGCLVCVEAAQGLQPQLIPLVPPPGLTPRPPGCAAEGHIPCLAACR